MPLLLTPIFTPSVNPKHLFTVASVARTAWVRIVWIIAVTKTAQRPLARAGSVRPIITTELVVITPPYRSCAQLAS